MKLLADTHVVVWSATDPQRLSASARAAIEDGANELSVSIVTAWEIAIKQSRGKLDLPEPAGTMVAGGAAAYWFRSRRDRFGSGAASALCLGIIVIHSIGC